MSARSGGDARTSIARKSDRELVVTRTFDAPARIVFEAWSKPELFRRWWVPKSFGLTMMSCEQDVRTGGSYRIEIGHPSSDKQMAFFGRYLEVVPPTRIVWTNDEGEGEGAVTTVTFEERGAQTLVTVSDLYPSREALDEAIENGSTSGFGEQFDQLDAVLAA